MGVEFELKFRGDETSQRKIREAFPGAWQEIQMHTRYYDTPSGALSQRKFTLRRRMENGVSVCTLKTPAGKARGEWEIRCDAIETAIPQLVAMGAPEELTALTAEGLVEICGARFRRQALLLPLENGAVEIALDQGVLTGGGKEIPLCEIEVELKQGKMEAAEEFGAELSREYGLQQEEKSKFRRALALAKGE